VDWRVAHRSHRAPRIRRIDNQLRGRAGRQGDPGSSRFYLSLQDDLPAHLRGERMQNLMMRLGMEEDVRSIQADHAPYSEGAGAVEAQNFEARKHLLEYDDVNNKQRQTVYGMRRGLLEGLDRGQGLEMVQASRPAVCGHPAASENKHPDTWEMAESAQRYPDAVWLQDRSHRALQPESRRDHQRHLRPAAAEVSGEGRLVGRTQRHAERMVMLQVIDNQWKTTC